MATRPADTRSSSFGFPSAVTCTHNTFAFKAAIYTRPLDHHAKVREVTKPKEVGVRRD